MSLLGEPKLPSYSTRFNRVHNELKETQDQLIQSEKMASIGQLVAGVVHEINNPINYIIGNITPVKITSLKKEDITRNESYIADQIETAPPKKLNPLEV